MELSVRCYLLDQKNRILLVRHADWQLWTLPGGHVEAWETVYEALKREVDEELGLGISLVGVESIVSTKNVIPLPLPISIHKVIYEHRTRGSTEKQEYFFFARMTGEISTISNDEIQEFKWFESDEILAMEEDVEIHGFIQEILDQNLDLLSIVG